MNKLEQAARQALEALEMAVSETLDYIQKNHLCGAENNHWIVHSKKAITVLREALAEPVKQSISEEAFNWIDANAPMFVRDAVRPVKEVELTDDELREIMKQPFNQREYMEQFARAVIAKYKEKNK